MSTPQEIKNEIMTELNANTDLQSFGIMAVFEGLRVGVSDLTYPYIALELVENNEIPNSVQTHVASKIVFNVIGVVLVKDVDVQLNAMLSIETAIKKCFSNNVQLNGKAHNI